MSVSYARSFSVVTILLLMLGFAPRVRADETGSDSNSERYGLLGLLDHRSRYGQGWFVEPLRGPEMDVDRELRIDYFHGEGHGTQSDEVTAEIEYNFDLLTIELELPYGREASSSFDTLAKRTLRERTEGIGSIELAARHPLFQAVSRDGSLDYTLAGAFELAIPSGSEISKDTEFVPQVFQLLRVGEHLSIEASAGFSFLVGPEEGGTNTFEYNVVLGYNLEHADLPIPGTLRTIPIFELNGERVFNREEAGTNRLFGTIGARFNLESVGPAQPRLGIGYVFPIDHGAREEMNWGIVTSFVLEF